MIQENITTDVLVIGAGGAGIRAALAASEAGVNVVLVTKGKATRSGSTFSSLSKGWGIQALVGEERTHKGLEEFYNDIISVGLGLCDPKLVKILVEESGLCLEELISFGLNFRKDPEGSYLRIGGCFSDVKRAFVTESLANIRETFNAMLKRSGAEIINGAVIDLITHENSCCGAWVLNEKNEPLRINARATIMASGGGGALYRYNLVTGGATGDGYALAHRAGARLVNMEFIQFMLGTHNGKGCRFFPLSEIMGRKPLLDENGNDILKACLPDPAERKESLQDRLRHYPFSCRDSSSTVDITVAEKMKKGEKVLWKDPGRDGALSEVVHCAHAFNGGIKIDKNAESTLPGLFAAGEVVAGPQGADRVGGCMMTATQVFGKRAGQAAARSGKRARRSAFPEVGFNDYVGSSAFLPVYNVSRSVPDIKREIKASMSKYLMVLRLEAGLNRCIDELLDCEARLNELQSKGAIPALQHLELRNMIAAGRIISTAALLRKESRGPHYREDFHG